jgi:hypothetical protein
VFALVEIAITKGAKRGYGRIIQLLQSFIRHPLILPEPPRRKQSECVDVEWAVTKERRTKSGLGYGRMISVI